MNRFIYIIPVVAVGFGYRIFLDYRRKREITSRLTQRPQLTDEEFGTHYFPAEQAEIATEIRRLLRRYLPFKLSGLHPSDAFVKDLHITTFYRTAMTEFLMEVEKRFGAELRHRDEIVIVTFGDLVEAVAREKKTSFPDERQSQ